MIATHGFAIVGVHRLLGEFATYLHWDRRVHVEAPGILRNFLLFGDPGLVRIAERLAMDVRDVRGVE
jgi:hypothetical protein